MINEQFNFETHQKCIVGSHISSNPPLLNAKNWVSPYYVRMNRKWYFMRASYGQEMKAKEHLTSQGIEVYCPLRIVTRQEGLRRFQSYESLIRNALFVYSDYDTLRQYVGQPPLSFLHFFYRPNIDNDGTPIGTGRTPIVIPDHQMQQFQLWHKADAVDKIYRPEHYTFKEGDRVYIRQGEFAGFEGQVVRYKGQTRVGTNIEGVGFIATTYIPKSFLEPIEKSKS